MSDRNSERFEAFFKRVSQSTLLITKMSPTFPRFLSEHASVFWLLRGSSNLHSILDLAHFAIRHLLPSTDPGLQTSAFVRRNDKLCAGHECAIFLYFSEAFI